MKTTLNKKELLALVLIGTSAFAGCSSFKSPTADYVKPGELCTDVSLLPDPNEPAQDQTVALRNIANQYGVGGKREESPERLLMQADSYFEQKRYHDSARLYKKYLATPVASTAAPELLGMIHYRIGFVADKKMFHDEANREYALALQYSPTNLDYLFGYAKSCYDSGDYQTAEQQLTAILQRSPSHAEATRYYGLTLLEGSARENALQPLVSTVGALKAYTLLTDKYYEIGDMENGARMEAQTIQIAAQSAQPIPRFPHKERLLASAQNATYAQTLAAMNAEQPAPTTPTAPQTPVVAQIAPSQPAQQQPVQAPVVPEQPVAPQVVAQQIAEPAPGMAQVPAPVVAPVNAPVAESVVAPAPQENGVAPVAPSPAPVADTFVAMNVEPAPHAVQYAQIGPAIPAASPAPTANPAPVASPVAPLTESPAPQSVQQVPQQTPVASQVQYPVQYPDVVPTPTPIEYDADFDDWDDSAFATSGAAEAPDQSAEYQFPAGYLQQIPVQEYQTPQDPYSYPQYQYQVPQEQYPYPQNQYQAPQEQYQYQYAPTQPSYSMQEATEEAFRLAAAHVDALESVERFADDARSAAIERTRTPRPRLVGYVSAASLKNVALKRKATDDVEIRPLTSANEDDAEIVEISAVPSNNEEAIPEPDVKKSTSEGDASVGKGNPGLFVAAAATRVTDSETFFRPGSIEENEEINQNAPDSLAMRVALAAKRRAAAESAALAEKKAKAANRDETWAFLCRRVDALEADRHSIVEKSFAYYEPLVRIENDENWDASSFAMSGGVGGFGDYTPPAAQAPVYVAQAPRQPVMAPTAPATAAQYQPVPTPQAQQPQPAPVTSRRQTTTPEERLEAARRAGAQIVELSPEQYRQAVATGLGQ